MATIYIENKPYQVKEGQNLLQACLSLGFDIPYFCWHPALHSVGACRQCAVKEFKDEKDTRGKVVMSCMTPVKEGTRISIDDPEAKAFRKTIIEWLMTNHPHDCPVCDEGGECHLQDMTLMTGHSYRRYRFKKRTYRNQDLGPFITHEMNRCIQCYRCVRYYRDYAGGRDFDVFAIHNAVYFGRHEEGALENEFSGNLVEICPTGVFTDKTLKRHYTRKWDLQTAPSICVHCGVGCNTIPGERYGEVRRIRVRYNGDVNRYFLCDRGRYGYEFVNSDSRVRRPIIRGADGANHSGLPQTGADAVNRISGWFGHKLAPIGIGSPRASLESNFALRTLVGKENFYSGLSDKETRLTALILDILRKGPNRTPSLSEVESCDAVLVLGEDLPDTAPVLALSIRQSVRQRHFEIAEKLRIPKWDDAAVREAAQDEKSPLFVAAPYLTRIEDIAAASFHGPPDEIARLGLAVAALISPALSLPEDLSEEMKSLAEKIAAALKSARRPLVVSGTGCGSESVIRAAADVASALASKGCALSFAVPECNTIGSALMGGGLLSEAFQRMEEGRADNVIVLENDIYRRAERHSVEKFLNGARHVAVLDHIRTETSESAEIVLPAATFAESDGTFVNNEGRGQRFYQVFVPTSEIKESWRWLHDIMAAAGPEEILQWTRLDNVIAAMEDELPSLKGVKEIAPPSGFRIAGMKVPRQSHRYSGRTSMFADRTVFEPRTIRDPDSALSYSMEGFLGEPPPALIPRFWWPGWNSPQAINKFQVEIGGPLHGGNPGIRLIEPASESRPDFFSERLGPFRRRKDEWLVLNVHEVFGSEELSMLSSSIAERAPKPYLGMKPEDALERGLKEGDEIELGLGEKTYRLIIRFMPSLQAGTVAFARIAPNLSESVPGWGRIL